jgi:hypothetical protein
MRGMKGVHDGQPRAAREGRTQRFLIGEGCGDTERPQRCGRAGWRWHGPCPGVVPARDGGSDKQWEPGERERERRKVGMLGCIGPLLCYYS